MKYLLNTIIISFLLIFLQSNTLIKKQEIKDSDSTKTITFSFVGDLMCHSPETIFASVGNDSIDYKPFFREVKKFLSSSDFTIFFNSSFDIFIFAILYPNLLCS